MEINSELLLASLTFLAVFAIGTAVLVARALRRQPLDRRLQQLEESEFDGLSPSEADRTENVSTLARITKLFSPVKPSQSLKATLAKAGCHGESAASMYLGAKVILFIVGTLVATVVGLTLKFSLPAQLWTIFSGGALLSFIPNVVVRARREKRCNEIRCRLPDAMDLLEICVSAGMGLDTAWNSVADPSTLSPVDCQPQRIRLRSAP